MNRILSLTTLLVLSCTLLCAGVGPGPGTTGAVPAVSATAPSSASAASALSPSVTLSTERTPSPANSPETLAEAKRQLAELNLTKAEKRAARRELKRMVKDMIAQHRANESGASLTASTAATVAAPAVAPRGVSNRLKLILAAVIGAAGVVFLFISSTAGAIFLVVALGFLIWYLVETN